MYYSSTVQYVFFVLFESLMSSQFGIIFLMDLRSLLLVRIAGTYPPLYCTTLDNNIRPARHVQDQEKATYVMNLA